MGHLSHVHPRLSQKAIFGEEQVAGSGSTGDELGIAKLDEASVASPQGIGHYRGLPAYALVRHAAETIPNREAIIYGDKRWTYESLNYDIVRCAAMLQALGIQPGDRVGVLLPNVPEFPIATGGIWRAGGIVVALSPLMAADEVSKLVEQTQCKIVITLDMLSQLLCDCEESLEKTLFVSIREHLPALQQLGYLWVRHQRTGAWSLPQDERHLWFWNELNQTRREWQPIEIDPVNDPAYILPTGGTTGSPKSVTLSHENLVANAWQQFEWIDRGFGKEKMMAVLPFFHSYGNSAILMAGAAMGATLVIHHRFSVRQVIQLMTKHQPSVLHAVPAMLIAINERLREYPTDLSPLRWVISGGAPLEAQVAEEFSQHSGALVVEGFGLSEASPVTHVGHLFQEPKYGSIGLPLPETRCRIIDDNGNSVADGEVGELLVSGPQVMLGYWDNPEATNAVLRDDWLMTGDLAIKDSDGYFRIVGRKKDLIITSGFNVYPDEVEAVLREADGVQDAAVVGQSDKRRGEIVKAFIVMKEGQTFDEDQLRAYCRSKLAKHKQPMVYERCIGELPKNFLGKVIRRELRETQPVTRGSAEAIIETPRLSSGPGKHHA